MTEFNDSRLPPVLCQIEWEAEGFLVSEITPTFTGRNTLSRVYRLFKEGESIDAVWDGHTVKYVDFKHPIRNLFNNLGI